MSSKPNILLITDDQHRFDFFGHTGLAGSLQTPAMDRLAKQGTVLSQTFSNCPVCMPTRFSWYHGLYASQAAYGLVRNNHDWPMLPSMPQALQQNGYHTAVIGKVHAHGGLNFIDLRDEQDKLLARGFDQAIEVCGKSLASWRDCHWTQHLQKRGLLNAYRRDITRRNPQLGGKERYEPSCLNAEDYIDGFIGNQALDWLNVYDCDKPFFLHVSFCAPHFPLDPPMPYFGRHQPEDMPRPIGVDDPQRIRQFQEHRAKHADMITLVDDQIARLLDWLDQHGLASNTVVIFGSDHGDMIGDLGLDHKGWAYDPSCRTPIIIRWPGHVPAGEQRDGMVEAVDLPCTLLEMAGCNGPIDRWLPQTPGRSFLPYITGQKSDHRDWAYAECELQGRDLAQDAPMDSQSWRMCCERDWKYVLHAHDREQFFDRQADPHEQHNLAADPTHAQRISRMRRQLIQSMSFCVAPNTMPQAPRRPIRETAKTGHEDD